VTGDPRAGIRILRQYDPTVIRHRLPVFHPTAVVQREFVVLADDELAGRLDRDEELARSGREKDFVFTRIGLTRLSLLATRIWVQHVAGLNRCFRYVSQDYLVFGQTALNQVVDDAVLHAVVLDADLVVGQRNIQ
jgi:hypothetical protein